MNELIDVYTCTVPLYCKQTHLPTASYLSEAAWMEENLTPDEIANCNDPTSRVKRHEVFMKYNASLAATKFTPKK